MKKGAPQCLGFIMDGNRRWAKENNLSTYDGHNKGSEVFIDSIRWIREAEVPHAVYYAFSTENWMRKEAEVVYLMDLFRDTFIKMETLLEENNQQSQKEKQVKIKIVGYREDFPSELQDKIFNLEKKSKQYPEAGITIWVALSYGGRAEIVEAVNKAIEKGERVTEESLGKMLWTGEMPDPDMIVRTSGECRLSNFVTWGSVYSELYFMEKHWPALTKTDFEDILIEYENRERRRGV